MGYRRDDEGLRERIDGLEAELSAIEAERRVLASAALDEVRLRGELEAAKRKLEQGARRLPLLEDVRIASPCSASWDEMEGDEKARFCGHCEKNVYDLSAMSRQEAEKLIAEKEGGLCVRLSRRKDGRVVTNDCPVGLKRLRRKRLVVALAGGGALAAIGATLFLRHGGDVAEAQGKVFAPPHTNADFATRWDDRSVLVTMGDVAGDPAATPAAPSAHPAGAPSGAARPDAPERLPGR